MAGEAQVRTSMGRVEVVVLGTQAQHAPGAACSLAGRCTGLFLFLWSHLHWHAGCLRVRLSTVA